MGKFNDRVVRSRRVQEIECSAENLVVTFDIARGSQRATHRVPHDECSWDPHLRSPVLESTNKDRCGRSPRFLEGACDVPDRHVAYRSHGDQQHHIDFLLVDALDPAGEFPP